MYCMSPPWSSCCSSCTTNGRGQNRQLPAFEPRRTLLAERADALGECSDFFLTQHPPEDLPRRALRQLGDEAVLARPLEARERVGGEAVLVELVRGDLTLDDDVGDDAVPEPVVGCADDGGLADGRVSRDHVFDLERVHVL